MGQTCRVCGIHVPSGFTNCNSCYFETNKAKEEEIKLLKYASKLGKLVATWSSKEEIMMPEKHKHNAGAVDFNNDF